MKSKQNLYLRTASHRIMKLRNEKLFSITGWIASAFAALCCIGVSILIGFLAAIGVGFLAQDRFLLPLLGLSLLLSLTGLTSAYRQRHKVAPLILGLLGIVSIPVSVLVFWKPGVYLGLVSLLAGTTWNLLSSVHAHRQASHRTR